MTHEERMAFISSMDGAQLHGELMAKAATSALAVEVIYVCHRFGISEDQFAEWFSEATLWHYDKALADAADRMPFIVSQSDKRTEDQIPTTDEPPRLF